MTVSSGRIRLGATITAAVLLTATCPAHILQYLTWFKISRRIEVSQNQVRVIHDCRFDPVVFRPSDPMIDTDGDSTASAREIAEFCLQSSKYLSQDFAVLSNGAPCETRQESFFVYPDNSGFRSEMVSPISVIAGTTLSLEFLDPSYVFPAPPSLEAQATSGTVTAVEPGISLLDENSTLRREIPTGHDVRTALRVVVTKTDHATTAPE